MLQSVARSVAHAQVLFLETEIARAAPFAIPFGTKKSCRGTVLSQNVDRRRRRIEVELVSASLRVTSPRAASRGHRGLAKRLDKRPLRRGFEYTAKHLPQRFRTSCCRKLFKKVVEIVVELTQNWCRDVFGVVPWGPKRLPRNEQAATRDPRGRSSDYSRELLENLRGVWDLFGPLVTPAPSPPVLVFEASFLFVSDCIASRASPRAGPGGRRI